MNTKKIIAMILSLVMVLCLAACGEPDPTTTAAPTNGTTQTPTEPNTQPTTVPVTTAPVDPVVPVEASVNFEDGNMGFIALYDGRANADASTIELVDWNGGKGLKITNGSGKVPYVAFDVWSLLGENAAKVRTIEMTMGIENPDGKFYACSGELMLWSTDKLSSTTYGWSVYMQNKNPKTAIFNLKDYDVFSADASPVMVVTLNIDNGATAGAANANLYIDDIRFLDADGNLIAADSSAVFAEPNGFGGEKDMSNLKYLKNTVSFDAMSGITGGAWGQNGVEMPEEFLAALVPGSIIEIEYTTTSETGDLWIVMPWANAGWIRVQQQAATKNNSHSICQITFEQIAAACGSDDVSTWGAMFQCESNGDWTVYSVKVGQDSGLVQTAGKTLIDGFSCTGDGWAQNGFELTADQWAMMVPGAVIEVKYTSESGNLWALLPWSSAGWMRINNDNGVTPICDGTTLQIPYEQIAAVCGEDVSTWGTMLQFESDKAWEVYSVTICSGSFKNVSGLTEIEGFTCTGAGWAQNGFELTADQWAMMVPGAIIEVKYTSESGNLWALLPWSSAGWMRINNDNGVTPICDGTTLQIPYEQIAAVCGEDVSTWGTMLQFESDKAWEVYSVSIGFTGDKPETPDEGGNENPDEGGTVEPAPEIPVPEIPAVPEGSAEIYSGTAPSENWSFTQVNTTVWGGTVDPTAFTDGGYFTVYFVGDGLSSVHFAFNGATWAQIDITDLSVATQLDDGTYMVTISVADLIAKYGTDLTTVGAISIYANAEAPGYGIVTLVTYTPAG